MLFSVEYSCGNTVYINKFYAAVFSFDENDNMAGMSNVAFASSSLPIDSVAPSKPLNLQGSVISVNQLYIGASADKTINENYTFLSWNPSTDNVGVAGYKIVRNGEHIGTLADTNFTDRFIIQQYVYNYEVIAFDEQIKESSPAQIQIIIN